MKFLIVTTTLLMYSFVIQSQAINSGAVSCFEKVVKYNERYYMIVEPKIKSFEWNRFFIQFDSANFRNYRLCPILNNKYREAGKTWQVINDSLYFLQINKSIGNEDKPSNGYKQNPLDSVFLFSYQTKMLSRKEKFRLDLPIHKYQEEIYLPPGKYNWYDIVHTRNEFFIFVSKKDTILRMLQIPDDYSRTGHYISKDEYCFKYLKQFKIFKLKPGIFLLNDLGEIFKLENGQVLKIGFLQINSSETLFYLEDNDNETVSFSCPFVSVNDQYSKIFGLITKAHWLYNSVSEIHKKTNLLRKCQ